MKSNPLTLTIPLAMAVGIFLGSSSISADQTESVSLIIHGPSCRDVICRHFGPIYIPLICRARATPLEEIICAKGFYDGIHGTQEGDQLLEIYNYGRAQGAN